MSKPQIPIPTFFERHYQVPPEEKTMEQCCQHGKDHQKYGWSPQLDPGWDDDQRQAYYVGYYGENWRAQVA